MSIEIFEYLAQQVLVKDDPTSCYELMEEYLKANFEKEENEKIINIIRETITDIGKPNITDIQENIALYAVERPDTMVKFYKWLNTRLNKVITEEWTLKEFIADWDSNYNKITKKMNSTKTQIIDRLALANIVIFIEDLKED